MKRKVKKVMKGLQKASKTHAQQAKLLKSSSYLLYVVLSLVSACIKKFHPVNAGT